MSLSQTSVLKLYTSVIEDVISGVRDAFLDEGVDEQVLQELKQIWESKLLTSKALEVQPDPPEPQPPLTNAQKEANRNIVQTLGNHLGQVNNHVQQPQAAQQQHLTQPTNATPILTDYNKPVPIQITLPPQQGATDPQPRVLTIQVPASALQGNQLHTVLTGPVIAATMSLPMHLASSLLQQHVTAALQGQAAAAGALQIPQTAQVVTHQTTTENAAPGRQPFAHQTAGPNAVTQLDGLCDTSDEDEDDDDDDDDDDDGDDDNDDDNGDDENEENEGGAEEEPLNSGDDVSEEDPTDMFDTDNVVVCQYDKITRSRNKWKFYLKDGIMNLSGKDFVFLKANGDAEW